MADALDDLDAEPRAATPTRLLDRFGRGVPGRRTGARAAGDRLEELLLTRIANENPALGPLRELVDDRVLASGTRYRGGDRRPRGDVRATAPPIGDGAVAARADARCRPATPRRRWPASCATSASTGAASSAIGS